MKIPDKNFYSLTLDRTSPLPLCNQLIDGLKKNCRKLAPGTRLPSEPELCKLLDCSRNLVRKALAQLSAEGILERRRPAGTFVALQNRKHRVLIVYSEEPRICDYLLEVVSGIEKAAATLNVELEKINIEFFRSGTAEERRRSIVGMKLDGILLVTNYYWGTEPELEILKDIGVPVIMPYAIPSDSEITPFRTMFQDMRLPVYAAIRMLRSWGHRHIAAISYEESGFHGVTAREFSAFAWHDEDHYHMVRCTGITDQEIEESVNYFLNLPEPPTVFLCHSDFYAARILDQLRKRHIRVPEDVSVMAVFAHRGSEMLTPPLTTISMQLAERGEAALHYLINGDFSAPLPRIESKLLFRQSVLTIKNNTKERS